jgi:hypothetical protein
LWVGVTLVRRTDIVRVTFYISAHHLKAHDQKCIGLIEYGVCLLLLHFVRPRRPEFHSCARVQTCDPLGSLRIFLVQFNKMNYLFKMTHQFRKIVHLTELNRFKVAPKDSPFSRLFVQCVYSNDEMNTSIDASILRITKTKST